VGKSARVQINNKACDAGLYYRSRSHGIDAYTWLTSLPLRSNNLVSARLRFQAPAQENTVFCHLSMKFVGAEAIRASAQNMKPKH
jgi:hypothetical protein